MTVSPSELIAGRTYFSLAYEDERLTRLYIHTLEYIRIEQDSPSDRPNYVFRFIGSRSNDHVDADVYCESARAEANDEPIIIEPQLDMILSFEELARELVRLAPTNGAWVYDDNSYPPSYRYGQPDRPTSALVGSHRAGALRRHGTFTLSDPFR